jgi:hypothetical protein
LPSAGTTKIAAILYVKDEVSQLDSSINWTASLYYKYLFLKEIVCEIKDGFNWDNHARSLLSEGETKLVFK